MIGKSETAPERDAIAPLVVTIAKAAELFSLGRVTINQLIKDGRLPARKLGRGKSGRVLIRVSDFYALLETLPKAAPGANDETPKAANVARLTNPTSRRRRRAEAFSDGRAK